METYRHCAGRAKRNLHPHRLSKIGKIVFADTNKKKNYQKCLDNPEGADGGEDGDGVV